MRLHKIIVDWLFGRGKMGSSKGDRKMELNNNGLIVSIYAHGNEWKVVHCARIGSRFGKSIVSTFANQKAALSYAKTA